MATARAGPEGWVLLEELGRGGNGIVYLARRDDGSVMALKLIDAKKPDREAYQRFAREITYLKNAGAIAGVLPIADAYLPENPSPGNQPWLAMPVARPVRIALAEASLESVVSAMAVITRTLSRLHAQDVVHRDVKPGNMFELASSFVVGDFGLVRYPGADDITRTGQALGPAHYVPHELVIDPKGTDAKPADVFAAAKTLWVLATRDAFPPDGYQALTQTAALLSIRTSHGRAARLDQMIEECTRFEPQARPTMAQLADSLDRWLSSAASAELSINISDNARVLREKMAGRRSREAEREALKNIGMDAWKYLVELAEPLNAALRQLDVSAQIEQGADEFTRNVVRTLDHFGAREIVFRQQRLSQIAIAGPGGGRRFALRVARTLEVAADGTLLLHIFMDVGNPGVMGARPFVWNPEPWEADGRSAESYDVMRTAMTEASRQLQTAADAFVQYLPSD